MQLGDIASQAGKGSGLPLIQSDHAWSKKGTKAMNEGRLEADLPEPASKILNKRDGEEDSVPKPLGVEQYHRRKQWKRSERPPPSGTEETIADTQSLQKTTTPANGADWTKKPKSLA